jgi:BASS family bile acid:Na+ symporter
MRLLAGRLVPIDFLKMVLEILNMVIVPVGAGLLANRVLYGTRAWDRRHLTALAGSALLLAIAMALLPISSMSPLATLQGGAFVGLGLIGLVALVKLVLTVLEHRSNTWLDQILPRISMTGICLIVAIITARSRERLLNVGGALILAAMLHNAIGYFLGYWLTRGFRMDEITCRTIAIEVGMQNGGMATGLAMSVLKSADAALAPAIFGPWMNISGSILAGWWRRRPTSVDAAIPEPAHADPVGVISKSTERSEP